MHSAYQSMFTCFSIVIFFYIRHIFMSKHNILLLLLIFIQFIFILLLASRMQIIIIIILAVTYFLITYYNRNKLIYSILYIGLFLFVIKLAVSIPSSLNYRYNETITNINNIISNIIC